jgi:Rhodopirellula transposase DDE domain
MELTEAVKELLLKTAKALKGSARRMFMARTVQALGEGGQRLAERELGWNRGTMRKGMLRPWNMASSAWMPSPRVVASAAKTICPTGLRDLTAIVDSQSQADPQFRTSRLYTRLSAAEVRRQLIAQKGYADEELPTAETIATKLNSLGYYPKKVAKSRPQKNCPKPMPSLPR